MEMQKRKNEGVIPICIKDFVFEYLVYSSAIHTEKTTKAFKVTFNQLKKFFGNIQLIKLTTIKMQEYIKHRIESSSIYAARKDLINLSSAFNRAVNNHYLINNPCKVIKRIKIPEKQPKFLSNLIIKYKFFITCIKDLQILCNS